MSALIFELAVVMDGGVEHTVVSDQRDVARWEVQEFGWPVTQLEDRPQMQFFRYLGWSALTRRGVICDMTWEDFDRDCAECMPVEQDETEHGGAVADDAADPGQPGPSASRSSRSRVPAASP